MKEIVIPFITIIALGSILLPLPPICVDILLAANLVFALVLFASALYITDPAKLSSLPSMLLLATLYRLCLNISTTRLILSGGDAGHMIEAFGTAIMQGNVFVGCVLFLVVTLVQFIVIAKGGERVAEVAARFTLDALPGKQMSIDADLRAGLLDREGAKSRREEVQIESRLYGALDGAMKFIKGDTIAGLVITSINIAGGLAAGVLMLDLELPQAVAKYTLLTVGDGLLSQIPALLNSLAAGMIVTRVVSTPHESLSSDILRQLMQSGKAKGLAGGVALILAFAPGAPTIPFLVLGGFLVLSCGVPSRKEHGNKKEGMRDFTPTLQAPIQFEIVMSVNDYQANLALVRNFPHQLVETFYTTWGVLLGVPEVRISIGDEFLCDFSLQHVKRQQFTRSDSESTEDLFRRITQSVLECVERRKGALLDDCATRRLLDLVEKYSPELVINLIPQGMSLTQLTMVFKGLLEENIPLRPVERIIQVLSENIDCADRRSELIQRVRIALREQIAEALRPEESQIFTLSQEFHHLLVEQTLESEILPLRLLQHIISEVARMRDPEARSTVVVVPRASRGVLSKGASNLAESMVFLCYEEVSFEIASGSVYEINAPNPESMEIQSEFRNAA